MESEYKDGFMQWLTSNKDVKRIGLGVLAFALFTTLNCASAKKKKTEERPEDSQEEIDSRFMKEGFRFWEQVEELNPTEGEKEKYVQIRAHHMIAEFALIDREWEMAEEFYYMALELDPYFILTLEGLGNVYLQRILVERLENEDEQTADSLSTLLEMVYSKIIQVDPNHAAAQFYFDRGEKLGKSDYVPNEKAKEFYEKAEILFSEKEFTESLRWYELAIEADSLFSRGYLSYAHSLYMIEEYDTAIGMFLKGLELNPNDAQGWHFLCSTYMRNGMLEEAKEACERALELYPEYPTAKMTLQRVEQELEQK